MKAFFKDRWILLFVLVVFVIFKIPHLYAPYFWDESWPYAPAVRAMHDHGISLLPSSMDPDLSRGHPLLFLALAGGWMKIFGPSHLAMHSFSLLVAVLFLIALYEAGLRMFNKRVGILAVVLVSTLLIFFIQSSFVLLEVLLGLLCFLSLVFYSSDKYVLTVLSLTAAFYTKESSLVMGFVLGIDAFIGLFNNTIAWKTRLLRTASVIVPCVMIGLFFLIQKYTMGWYIFPLHNNLIEHKWSSFYFNIRGNALANTFSNMYKFWYYLLLLAVAGIAAIKNRDLKYLAPLLPAILIYILIDDRRGGDVQLSYLLLPLLLLCTIAMFYLFRVMGLYASSQQRKMMELTGAFFLSFMCFCAVNFFTYRYLIVGIVPLFFFMAVVMVRYVDRTSRFLFYPVLLLSLSIGLYSFSADKLINDTEFGAFDAMDTEQKEVDFMEQHNLYDTPMAFGSFLTYEHLIDPSTGFLKSDRRFTHITWGIDDKTEYIFFNNLIPDYRYEAVKNKGEFIRIFRYDKGGAWTEIYQRRHEAGK